MSGLAAAGLKVCEGRPVPADVEAGDVLVIWNRYGEVEQAAENFEARGGRVIVAENGYLNPGGGIPKFDAHEGRTGYYALALNQHNGAGRWPDGDGSRWAQLGIDLNPMREDGEHVLICPNRHFGSKTMHPPENWTADAARRYGQSGKTVRIRHHPGNTRPARDLAEDLKGCAQMVIWASSAGLYALIQGIRVVCEAPHWICKGATPETRQRAFERLAWAQWDIPEIASGEPFKRLLAMA